MKIRLLSLLFLILSSPWVWAQEKQIGAWMSPGGPWGIWEKTHGDPFPVKMIVKDLADLGVKHIWFFEQCGRGGAFLHPTQVPYAKTEPRMKGRDFLKELLEVTAPYGIQVWLAWTPPEKEYPGTSIKGLNNPALIKIYTDEIEEVAKNYGQYKNLAGIMWHEVDCSEAPDGHEDDVGEFAEFCVRNFGERYVSDRMPEVNAEDRWWRRFYLYKIDIVNSLVAKAAEVANKHGLKSHFCFYAPECYSGESWRWGYDVVALEKLCDLQWFAGYGVESGKPYQTIRGAWIDFGPSYRGQILPRNYSYGFHGSPLSYFEYRSPVYIQEMRRYYAGIKGFNEKYGDIYTGYKGCTEKEVSLFLGKANLKNWLELITWWQGGESAAKVAVAVNPTPFVMTFPANPGGEYEKKVRGLMEGLTHATDVDGFIMESRFSLSAANLLKYSLIIIPEDMGAGLSTPMAKALRQYVGAGGHLLVMATPLKTGKADLTDESDLTLEICGVQIARPRLPGYIRPTSEVIALEDKKFWAAGIKEINIREGEVLVKEGIAGYPLLVKRGNVYFSAMGYSPESTAYFGAVVKHIATPPVTLSEGSEVRILESVKKSGMVCLPLWGRGKAQLKADVKALGLGEDACRAKDIVTGKVLGGFSAEALNAGIPVEIKYVNQPFVLVLGPVDAVEGFKGIYPSEGVFEGMTEGVAIENPEVPLSIPDKAGIKVGVYHGGLGASSIISALNKKPGINCYSLPRLDSESFNKSQVVVIPQVGAHVFFKQAAKALRSWVEGGGGVLLLHDAVGYRGHMAVFPELGKAATNPKLDTVRVVKAHPVTLEFGLGQTFIHAYADHVILEGARKDNILLEDEKGNAVLVAGEVGKGRVVLNGMLTGYASKGRGSFEGEEKAPTGEELKLLVNSVKWLAGGSR